MKKTLLVILSMLMASAGYAQFRISPGIAISSPKSDTYVMGAGFNINFSYMVSDHLAFGINTSYNYFFNKSGWEEDWYAEWGWEYRNNNRKIGHYHGNVAYYFGQKALRPYLGFEVGITQEYINYEYHDISYNRWHEVKNTENSVGIAPIAGFEVSLNKSLAFDLNMKYHLVDVSYFSVNAGFCITL